MPPIPRRKPVAAIPAPEDAVAVAPASAEEASQHIEQVAQLAVAQAKDDAFDPAVAQAVEAEARGALAVARAVTDHIDHVTETVAEVVREGVSAAAGARRERLESIRLSMPADVLLDFTEKAHRETMASRKRVSPNALITEVVSKAIMRRQVTENSQPLQKQEPGTEMTVIRLGLTPEVWDRLNELALQLGRLWRKRINPNQIVLDIVLRSARRSAAGQSTEE